MILNGKNVYLLGIGGIAMGNLAGFLQEKGYNVQGSDRALYSPMREFLMSRKIPIHIPYSEVNLLAANPEIVIIGNVVRSDNPEVRRVLADNIPYKSMPEALNLFILDHHKAIVVAGTHGKSTTTAMLAWVMAEAGMDPSAFIGALLHSWSKGYRTGNGDFAVIEGDEYDTAFFDKRPKFLHYKPYGAIVTGIEFDHADIYKSLDDIRKAFEAFVELIPPDGILVTRSEDPYVDRLKARCRGKVITYGCSGKPDWKLISWSPEGMFSHLTILHRSRRKYTFSVRAMGQHNALNSVAALALINALGYKTEDFIRGFETYPGLWRRQDVLFQNDFATIIDDFAHHPTAVRETIRAVVKHFPYHRIIAIFEPRTNTSKKKFFQEKYSLSFDGASYVIIKAPADYFSLSPGERIDLTALVNNLKDRGIEAAWTSSSEDTISRAIEFHREGDIILCMSNGDMDGVPHALKSEIISQPRNSSRWEKN